MGRIIEYMHPLDNVQGEYFKQQKLLIGDRECKLFSECKLFNFLCQIDDRRISDIRYASWQVVPGEKIN